MLTFVEPEDPEVMEALRSPDEGKYKRILSHIFQQCRYHHPPTPHTPAPAVPVSGFSQPCESGSLEVDVVPVRSAAQRPLAAAHPCAPHPPSMLNPVRYFITAEITVRFPKIYAISLCVIKLCVIGLFQEKNFFFFFDERG